MDVGIGMAHEAAVSAASRPRWSAATRVAFRFGFVYIGLYVLTTQMLGGLIVLPAANVPSLETLPPLRNLTQWVAAHVFRVAQPLVITGSGSGDKIFDWVHACCLLAVALGGAVAWSIADRRRTAYPSLHAWFVVFLRLFLGATMVTYGAVKVVPLQMPAPSLTRLLEPFGQFSPMGVLWYSVGASRPYEMFTGSIELLSGILLFVPALATLGALVTLAAATQIFALNMTYDVPVKLFSLHLIVMALILLAPDLRRLADAFVFNRAVPPASRAPLVRSRRAARWIGAAQIAAGMYVIGMHFYGAAKGWTQFGGGAAKPALYGVWNVDEMIVGGAVRPPLVTDNTRWRRIVIQTTSIVSFQRMNETVATFPATFDSSARRITLRKPDKSIAAEFVYERPSGDRLILDGTMDGAQVRLTTHAQAFPLLTRGFHWAQEYPFNR